MESPESSQVIIFGDLSLEKMDNFHTQIDIKFHKVYQADKKFFCSTEVFSALLKYYKHI